MTEVEVSPKARSGRPTKLRRAQRYGAGGFAPPQRGDDSTLAAALLWNGASCRATAARVVLAGLRPWGWPVKQRCFARNGGRSQYPSSIFSLGLLCAAIGRLYQLRQPIAARNTLRAADFAAADRARTAPEQTYSSPQASGCISNWINRRAR